jgi:V-type H+-transporting ATPase subunit C
MTEPKLFAIAVKMGESPRELTQKVAAIAKVQEFRVSPNLRVGTLDTLMSLSDDLIKMDTMSEATVWKIYRQLTDLKDGKAAPKIKGGTLPAPGGVGVTQPLALLSTPAIGRSAAVDVATYAFKQFEWAEEKFQTKTPLRELSESISGRIGGLDEELKTKLLEYNTIKGSLQQFERKLAGNLMVRGLTDIVQESDMRGTVGSEMMTTLLIVVPKHGYKEFLSSYETVCPMITDDKEKAVDKKAKLSKSIKKEEDEKVYGVVPRSAKLITEDTETGLYAVVVFKKYAGDFAAAAREKRWAIRDFTYDPNKLADENAKRESDMAEEDRLKGLLINWCEINFAEAYTMMMHLKAVRIFVESVLRYGLQRNMGANVGPNFRAFLLQPMKGKEDALHKALGSLYGGGSAADFEGDEETVVPGATGEFYPYVFCNIDTDAPGLA